MKCLFFALILTLTQPLPPLPWQTVNKQAEKGGAKAQVSDNRQNPPDPSPSIVVMKNCGDENESANAGKHEGSNLHQETQKQPTPWSRSDKLTFAYDILTGLLVCIALGTGAAVAYQAIEMRRATNAMRDQLLATTRSERAWVIAELAPMAKRGAENKWLRWVGGGKTVLMGMDEILRGEHLRHGLRFVNMGRTVARICGYQIHIGLWDHKKEVLKIQRIDYNGDFDRMLAGSEATEVLPDQIIDIHEIASNPTDEIDTWKNWLVILVVVSYQHVFSGAEFESEVFRFVYNPKKMNVRRAATTEADKEQARNPRLWAKDGTSSLLNPN